MNCLALSHATDCASAAVDSYLELLDAWHGGEPFSWVDSYSDRPRRREFTLWHHVENECQWWGVDSVRDTYLIARAMFLRLT